MSSPTLAMVAVVTRLIQADGLAQNREAILDSLDPMVVRSCQRAGLISWRGVATNTGREAYVMWRRHV